MSQVTDETARPIADARRKSSIAALMSPDSPTDRISLTKDQLPAYFPPKPFVPLHSGTQSQPGYVVSGGSFPQSDLRGGRLDVGLSSTPGSKRPTKANRKKRNSNVLADQADNEEAKTSPVANSVNPPKRKRKTLSALQHERRQTEVQGNGSEVSASGLTNSEPDKVDNSGAPKMPVEEEAANIPEALPSAKSADAQIQNGETFFQPPASSSLPDSNGELSLPATLPSPNQRALDSSFKAHEELPFVPKSAVYAHLSEKDDQQRELNSSSSRSSAPISAVASSPLRDTDDANQKSAIVAIRSKSNENQLTAKDAAYPEIVKAAESVDEAEITDYKAAGDAATQKPVESVESPFATEESSVALKEQAQIVASDENSSSRSSSIADTTPATSKPLTNELSESIPKAKSPSPLSTQQQQPEENVLKDKNAIAEADAATRCHDQSTDSDEPAPTTKIDGAKSNPVPDSAVSGAVNEAPPAPDLQSKKRSVGTQEEFDVEHAQSDLKPVRSEESATATATKRKRGEIPASLPARPIVGGRKRKTRFSDANDAGMFNIVILFFSFLFVILAVLFIDYDEVPQSDEEEVEVEDEIYDDIDDDMFLAQAARRRRKR